MTVHAGSWWGHWDSSGHKSFTRWITSLRIDEAKRILHKHPEWTNEAVADHCGFSRTHFQKIFKQETGYSPTDFRTK
ncbi:MAG: AraC family transcriptional regulator [Prevotella sp.]|nr:AraC family transcriptional regulator [Prevotella sp.]